MAGNGAARSAGVAYIDLAVGDTKALIEGITQLVRQAADQAQQELSRGFDLSGHAGSFQAIVDEATNAASGAGEAISSALQTSASDTASSLSGSITGALSQAAAGAAEAVTRTAGEAGRQAGEQLALNFEEAAGHIQLPLFEEEAVTQATEQARLAAERIAAEFAETLQMQMSHDFDASNASLGSVFTGLHFQGIAEDLQGVADTITGGLRFAATGIGGYFDDLKEKIVTDFKAAGQEGGEGLSKSFEEFKAGITYSVGSWGIGYMIGNSIMTGVTSALSFAKDAIFGFNSEMQSAQISFGTLLGSDQAATGMLSQLKQFTLGTPFMFSDITEGAQKLLALGINAKNIIPDLRGLGDAVSALGGDSSTLNSVVQVFGEMQSKGQVMETQIRELQIRGIPALQILANEYGVSTTELAKMIRSGNVMADDALPKLIDGLEKGTKSTVAMGGEMARQSLTFKGSISNLKDGVTQFAAGAFKPAFDEVNKLTAKLANFASGGSLEKFVGPISANVAKGVSVVGDYVSKFIHDIAPAGQIVKDLAENLIHFSIVLAVLRELAPFLLAIAQAIGAIGRNATVAHIIADIAEGFIFLKGVQEAYNLVLIVTNGLMEMSPLGLIVLGITAAVIGFTMLYQHSALFRDIIHEIAVVAEAVWHGLVVGFDYVVGAFKAAFQSGPAQGIIGWLVSEFRILRAVAEGEIRLIGSIFSWLWSNVLAPVGNAIAGAFLALGSVAMWLYRNAISPMVSGIETTFRAIATVAVWLYENIFKPVFEGIWFVIRLVFVIGFTLVFTSFVIVYHLIEPLLKALGEAFVYGFHLIGEAASWLWKNALKPFFDWFAGLFTGGLAKAIVSFYRSYIEPAFTDIGKLAVWLWKNILEPFVDGWITLFEDAGRGAERLWKEYLSPALNEIGSLFVSFYKDALTPIGHGIMDLIGFLGAIFVWLWKNAIDPALHGIADLALWLWQNALDPAFRAIAAIAIWLWKNAFEPAFSGIATAGTWMYRNILKPLFDEFMLGVQTLGNWAVWLYDHGFKPAFEKISSVVSTVLGDIKTGFKTAVDGITDLWNSLEDKLKGPVNFILDTVYTHGIEATWNFIAEKVDIPKLPDVTHFASGGVVPGPQSAGDWIPVYATAGEGILSLPEMAALGGPAGFNALRRLLGGGGASSGDGHYKFGGVVDSLFGEGKSLLGDLASFASRVVKGGLKSVATDMMKPVLNGLSGMMPGDSAVKQLLTSVPEALVNGILSWLGGKDKKDQAQASAGLPADVASWINAAEPLAGVGTDWTAGLAQIISHESGGNPWAINLTDSNAQAGDPSRGLMQTIMSTFEAFRLPSLPDDIFDPVSNIVAGIRYIINRYTSIGNVPGIKSMASGGPYVGYATGTGSAMPGWAWVGENGPELLKFSGGESVLPSSQSMAVAGRQTAFSPIGFSAAAAAPPIVNVYIDGQKFDGRIDVKIQQNNNALAQILNGGVIA